MRQYIIRRLLYLIPVFLGITMIVFGLIYTSPGNPFMNMIEMGIDEEQLEARLQAIGYYDPLPIKYVKWLSRAVQGDLGYSIYYSEPVMQVLSRRISNTLLLSSLALVLSVIISVPLGIISATRQYSMFDYFVTILALIGLSIPPFFFALGLIKIFSIDLRMFPLGGLETIGAGYTGMQRALDMLRHLFLPLVVLTFVRMGQFMRYTRSAMLEVIQQDYIRTARAKGLSERVVIYRHALRNALLPLVSLVTISLGYLISGAAIVETVFAYPGMGTLIFQSVQNRDYTVMTAGTLILALCVLFSNVLADIIYAVADPRIKYD